MTRSLQALEGKYEILDKMSEGGMGSVYKVRHRLLEEIRVVKVMRSGLAKDEVFRERFLREARVAIKLRHPNLAQVYDFTVSDDGQAFLIMEFIDGLTVHDLLRVAGPPSVLLASEIMTQALDVIGYLHQRQVVHRDISPDNLMVSLSDDRRPMVKLIDLGIASTEGGKALTTAGVFLGKVRYSSPEHFRTGEGVVIDGRSDLYCLSLVAYELLTGHHPIAATETAALIAGHLVEPPRPFDDTDPDGRVAPALRVAVLRGLAKSPSDRFSTADEMARAVRKAVGSATPPDLDAFARLFDGVPEETIDLRRPKPGSTQDRLDRSFKMEPTPAARIDDGELDGNGPASVRQADTGRPQVVDSTLETARSLRAAGRLEDAVVVLRELMEVDPVRSEAVNLLGDIEREIEDRRAEDRIRREIEDSVASIRRSLEQDRPDDAERALRLGRKVCGDQPVFDELEEAVDSARGEAKRRAARELLEAAESALVDGDWRSAAPSVDRAHDLAPDVEGLEAIRRRIELLQSEEREEARRQEAMGTAANRIEQLLRLGRFEAASRSLAEASEELGNSPRFDQLGSVLEEAVAERRQVESRGWELLDRARREAEGGRLDAARSTLQEGRSLEQRVPELGLLAVEIEEDLRQRAERARRDTAVLEASASVTSRLEADEVDLADRELAVAERLYPDDVRLDALRDQVVEARRHRTAERFEERLRAPDLEVEDLDGLIADLEQTLADDPRHLRCRSLLGRVRVMAARRSIERDARNAAELVTAVERSVLEGDLEAARGVLDNAPPELASRPDLRRLREELLRLVAE